MRHKSKLPMSSKKGKDMTITEALEARIPRVRKSAWVKEAYLRLPLLENGKIGPWAELYSEYDQKEILGIEPGSQKLCVLLPDVAKDDGFERYEGPPSKYEMQSSYASNYSET